MLDKLPHGRIVSYVSVMLIEWLTVVLMLSEEPLPNLARVSALIIEGSAPRARDGGKGIDETTAPATDHTAKKRRPLFLRRFSPGRQRPKPEGRGGGADSGSGSRGSEIPRRHIARRGERSGRFIRHAPLRTAFPIFPLTVTMIETTLRAVLMAAVGFAPWFAKGRDPTLRTAITLTAITVLRFQMIDDSLQVELAWEGPIRLRSGQTYFMSIEASKRRYSQSAAIEDGFRTCRRRTRTCSLHSAQVGGEFYLKQPVMWCSSIA